MRNLETAVKAALAEAKISLHDLDGIAVTAGPGLIGGVIVGTMFAKGLASVIKKPFIAVNHLEGHVLTPRLTSDVTFPYLSLLVSGGHCQFIAALELGKYKILGQTLDDAVGEAFDKTAKLMGLPYPGGAVLASLADNAIDTDHRSLPDFPRPMLNKPGLDFSFSGLKTHALISWNKSDKTDAAREVIARAFQEAVVATLVAKSRRAMEQVGCAQLVVAGGVGANRALRNALGHLMQTLHGRVYFPRMEFCTDNGAMVAYAGCLHLLTGEQDRTLAISVKARWPLDDL